MYMDIDETWNDQTIGNGHDGRLLLGNGNNTALLHEKVHLLKAPFPKNSAAGQQQTHARAPLSKFSRLSTILNGGGIVNGEFLKNTAAANQYEIVKNARTG